ncbi:MAG: hypothetical protein V7742_21635 [Halioglobus sp.]
MITLVSGCGTIPKAAKPLKHALEEQNYNDSVDLTVEAFEFVATHPGYAYSASEDLLAFAYLYEQHPEARQPLIDHYSMVAQTISSLDESEDLEAALKLYDEYEIIGYQAGQAIKTASHTQLERMYINGQIKISFSSKNYSAYPFLSKAEHQSTLFNDALVDLKGGNASTIGALVSYVSGPHATDTEKENLLSKVDSLELTRSQLLNLKKAFPDYANERLKKYHIFLYLIYVDDEDYFLQEALDIVANTAGIEFVDSIKQSNYIMEIDKRRLSERETPHKTETIRYSKYEVDTMNAVLFMPKGASYIYELHSGGHSLSYKYSVEITPTAGESSKYTLTGKTEDNYQYCDGARVQNVFGGVQAANFSANDNMRSRCSGNDKSGDPDKNYNNAVKKLSKDIIGLGLIRNKLHWGNERIYD